jgi:transcriptional repressor NrdR
MVLAVVKRSGVTEQFSRDKVVREIPSHEVGLAILGPLRELDGVAYLRFASVYRSFSSVEDFEKEISDLREAMAGPDESERRAADD